MGMHTAIGKLETQAQSTDLLKAHPDAMVLRLPLGQEPTGGCLHQILARQGMETDTSILHHLVAHVRALVWWHTTEFSNASMY